MNKINKINIIMIIIQVIDLRMELRDLVEQKSTSPYIHRSYDLYQSLSSYHDGDLKYGIVLYSSTTLLSSFCVRTDILQ
jgi:hypothetical protein